MAEPQAPPGLRARTEALFLPPDDFDDNLAYLAWLKQCIQIMQVGAICVKTGAAAANASMRPVGAHSLVGGIGGAYRANMCTRPVEKAADEGMVPTIKWLYTAKHRFEAAFQPELEAVGYRIGGRGGMKFRAG